MGTLVVCVIFGDTAVSAKALPQTQLHQHKSASNSIAYFTWEPGIGYAAKNAQVQTWPDILQ